VIFQSLSARRCEKVEIQQRIAFGIYGCLHSRMCELTCPTTGSTIEFGARHLRWYWRQASFQKDNRHTRVLNVCWKDDFYIDWASDVQGGALVGRVAGGPMLPIA
jgi:hypothetical protein